MGLATRCKSSQNRAGVQSYTSILHGNRRDQQVQKSWGKKLESGNGKGYSDKGLTQTRLCSSQSSFWCAVEQYLTSLHRLHARPVKPRSPFSLPSLPSMLPSLLPSETQPAGGVSSAKHASHSIQLHISFGRAFLPYR